MSQHSMSTMLPSQWKKARPILWPKQRSKLANSIPPLFQSEGFNDSVVNPSRLVSQAPVSNQNNTFTLDENSRLMEDVRNFLQQSPVQASPLDTTQSTDNSGYQASPTIQKLPLIGISSTIQKSPMIGCSSRFPIKPKAVPRSTSAYVEGSSDVGSSAFIPIP